MGEAKRRGTFEERKAKAIAAGRVKRAHLQEIIFRKFILWPEFPWGSVSSFTSPPLETPKIQTININGNQIDRTIRAVPCRIRQPGTNRKEHKSITAIQERPLCG